MTTVFRNEANGTREQTIWIFQDELSFLLTMGNAIFNHTVEGGWNVNSSSSISPLLLLLNALLGLWCRDTPEMPALGIPSYFFHSYETLGSEGWL